MALNFPKELLLEIVSKISDEVGNDGEHICEDCMQEAETATTKTPYKGTFH
jgi:hypothetical protein